MIATAHTAEDRNTGTDRTKDRYRVRDDRYD
jgi:hypothetical protein